MQKMKDMHMFYTVKKLKSRNFILIFFRANIDLKGKI